MNQEGNDRKEAPKSHTDVFADRIFQGYENTKSLFSSARIHRMPKDLRGLNDSAYTPHLMAIGPLHRDDPHLPKTMKDVKLYYANSLLFQVAKEDPGKRDKKKVLEDCVKKMEEEECIERAKKPYAEEVKVKNDAEMAEMMLVDGCFILQLLYASYCHKKTKEAEKITTKGGDSGNSKALSSSGNGEQPNGEKRKLDPILDNILIANIIKHDLLLFENQIPFFVLEDLFKLTVDQIPGGNKLSLTEYVVSYFADIICPEGNNGGRVKKTGCCSPSDCVLFVRDYSKENEPLEKKKPLEKVYHHILHLVHDYYSPGDQWKDKRWEDEQNSAKKFSALEVRASELDHGGVKFVPVEGNNLFDVKFNEPRGIHWWFHRATFEIPTIVINDVTEPFLRNLIAFEQFCPGVLPYFTWYANLMDVLINSEKDVEVLSKANVIRNFSGTDEDVSKLLNKLCKEVVAGFFFEDACQKAFEYSKHCWPRYMAYWRRTYFASPWAFKGVCLALILFFIQVVNFVHISLHKR